MSIKLNATHLVVKSAVSGPRTARARGLQRVRIDIMSLPVQSDKITESFLINDPVDGIHGLVNYAAFFTTLS